MGRKLEIHKIPKLTTLWIMQKLIIESLRKKKKLKRKDPHTCLSNGEKKDG